MEEDRNSLPNLVLQPYIVDILKELRQPKRFTDLHVKIKSRQTLSVKLKSLSRTGLIKQTPLLVKGKYANAFVISEKGKKLLKVLGITDKK